MFFIFLRACKRYKFVYTLHAINEFSITMHPKEALGFVEVKLEYYDRSYFKLFVKAIKKMKEYRKENGYR